MPKACLSCGTVNASNAKFCNKCGKPFSSKAGGGGGKRVPCKQCSNKLRLVKGGPFTKYIPHPGPIDQYEEEWVYYVLECGHDYLVKKTGKERDWEP